MTATHHIGIDLAKDLLEVAGDTVRQITNQPAALKVWLGQLKTRQPGALGLPRKIGQRVGVKVKG